MKKSEHIGFPLPSEMFHDIPVINIDEEWDKHYAATKLLDIPLKCPKCGEKLRNA